MAKAEYYNKWKGMEEISLPKDGVTIKLLSITEDPEPENRGRPIIPNVLISPTDRIFVDNKTYDIACISAVSASGEATFETLMINASTAGLRKLRSGNPKDERDWKFLSLTSQNASNPDRDTSIEPKFFVFDAKKESEERIVDIKYKTQVLSACFSLNNSDLAKVAKALGVGGNSLLEDIVKMADKKPTTVKDAIDLVLEKDETPAKKEKEVSVKELVLNAVQSKLIIDDKKAKKVFLDGEEILSYDKNLDATKLIGLFESSEELLKKIS